MPAKYRIKDTPVMCEGEKGDIVYACIQDDFNAALMLTQNSFSKRLLFPTPLSPKQ